LAELAAAAANSGGAALVAAAATDAWAGVKAGVVALFTQTGRREDVVAQWADQTAVEIAAAPEDPAIRQRWETVWQQRVMALVQEHPEIGELLQQWPHDTQTLAAARPHTTNTFIAGGNPQQYNAPHGSQITHHYGERPPQP